MLLEPPRSPPLLSAARAPSPPLLPALQVRHSSGREPEAVVRGMGPF